MKYIITIILIVLGGIAFYALDHGATNQGSVDNQTIVQDPNVVIQYISQNISKLSPEKEQLGGTFYVTNITLDSGTGVVEYEDGHNAYTARFEYVYIDESQVRISNFSLVE